MRTCPWQLRNTTLWEERRDGISRKYAALAPNCLPFESCTTYNIVPWMSFCASKRTVGFLRCSQRWVADCWHCELPIYGLASTLAVWFAWVFQPWCSQAVLPQRHMRIKKLSTMGISLLSRADSRTTLCAASTALYHRCEDRAFANPILSERRKKTWRESHICMMKWQRKWERQSESDG